MAACRRFSNLEEVYETALIMDAACQRVGELQASKQVVAIPTIEVGSEHYLNRQGRPQTKSSKSGSYAGERQSSTQSRN